MPEDLRKAHTDLNKAIDKCYGKQVFKTEMERIKFLFGLYQKKIEPLLSDASSKKKTKKKTEAEA
jgi:hypothetical protein